MWELMVVSSFATFVVWLVLRYKWYFALAQACMLCFLVMASLSLSQMSATIDKEVWNGSISDKLNVRKDCPVGWNSSTDDFCTEYTTRVVDDGQSCSGSGKDRTCIENYHTEYNYEYNWEGKWYFVSKDLNARWEVKRVDKQGATMPPFYTTVKEGDPASKTHDYTNWVRAASDSVFHEDGDKEEKYKDMLPEYPIKVKNIFQLDRVLAVGVDVPNISEYNRLLSVTLRDLGPVKQMNAIVVLVDANKASSDYAYAVRRAWKGFKKNDAVVFIGLKDGNVSWSEVLSWSKDSIFNVSLREDVLAWRDQPLDVYKLMDAIHYEGMTRYKRREMAEFEFLKDQIPTPMSVYVLLFLLEAIVLGASTWFIVNKLERYNV